jgi:hypothetical protein
VSRSDLCLMQGLAAYLRMILHTPNGEFDMPQALYRFIFILLYTRPSSDLEFRRQTFAVRIVIVGYSHL